MDPLEMFLRPLIVLMNRQIRATTPAREICLKITGSVVAISVRDTSLAAYVHIRDSEITMTGRYDVKRVEIEDSLLKEDKDVLEDLVAAAVNDAVRRVEKNQQDKMSSLTAGIPLPPGFKFPFS